jgi:hypothetical protein
MPSRLVQAEGVLCALITVSTVCFSRLHAHVEADVICDGPQSDAGALPVESDQGRRQLVAEQLTDVQAPAAIPPHIQETGSNN